MRGESDKIYLGGQKRGKYEEVIFQSNYYDGFYIVTSVLFSKLRSAV